MRKPKTATTLREDATKLLRRFHVNAAPVPVDQIAMQLGANVRYSPFDGELAGMLVRSESGEIVIGVNSLHHKNRQRFTIAHEIAHLLLHKGELHIDRTFRVNRRDQNSATAEDPEEIEANRFAAELLMPHDLVLEDLANRSIDVEDEAQIKEIALKYQVSLQAMTLRITNLVEDLF